MADPIARIDTYLFEAPRDEPYLGPLAGGEAATPKGYVVRAGNRTVYPTCDRAVVVRVTTASGEAGWGETYGLVAPGVIAELFDDLIIEFVRGEDALAPEPIHDRLYDLMRVRGYTGGFWLDALAALDIALWDLTARARGLSLCAALGGTPDTGVAAYVSGLPGSSRQDRVAVAEHWAAQGFSRFKMALAAGLDDLPGEYDALYGALGADLEVAVDLHWRRGAADALALCAAIADRRPWYVEAPCLPEDIAGLRAVCRATDVPVAVGEEWRTVHDATLRLDTGIAIVQPEMGHTGVTQFRRIADAAVAAGKMIMPHATIGMGIFLTASLHAAAAVGAQCHEFQHSIMTRNAAFLDAALSCRQGAYQLPAGPGLGVTPSTEGARHLSLLRTSK